MRIFIDKIKSWISDIKFGKGDILSGISSQQPEISSIRSVKSDNMGPKKNNNTRLIYNNIIPEKYEDWDEKNWDKDEEKII